MSSNDPFPVVAGEAHGPASGALVVPPAAVGPELDVPRGVRVVLALDIGPSRFTAGLLTARGDLLARSRVDTEIDAGPESLYTSLAAVTMEMLSVARDRHQLDVVAAGVLAPGPVSPGLDLISPVSIPVWRNFPLRERLERLTGLATFGDTDAKGLALAEGWRGAAQGQASFCAITVSVGIGGGVVLDGELLEGARGQAGHIAHVIVEPGGRRCPCGALGCLEAVASGLAIESITGRPLSEPTYEIMQRTGRAVGIAAADVCNALDLSLVVVGGTVALGFAATFFHAAQVALDEYTMLPYSRGARITPSRLGDSGPLIGAGALGWRGLRRARRSSRA